MNEILAFLLENRIVYLATVDGNIPKVRPFGFVMEFEGKLYFSTSNQKSVYKQLKANPNFEVSIISKTGDWLRLQGKAVFNTTRKTRQAALDAVPAFSKMYSIDDAIFELFYIEDGEATFNDTKGSSRTVTL